MALAVGDLRSRSRHRLVGSSVGRGLLIAGGGSAALLGASLAASGHFTLVLLLPVLFVPVILLRKPDAAPVFLVGAATLIEQYPDLVASGAITGRIPLFVSLQAQFHLTGLFVSPIELLLGLILIAWALRHARPGARPAALSGMSRLVLLMLGLVMLAEVWGLSRGGNSTWSLWEVRPWVYLGAAYAVAVIFVRTPQMRHAVLWAFAVGVATKGIQGLANAITMRDVTPHPEAILSHEEAFFFGIFVLLTAALWMFGMKGRLRTFCTLALPIVVYADLANYRRATWIIIGGGLIALTVLTVVRFPKRRTLLLRWIAVVVVVGAVYSAAMWNSNGTLAEPVRALRSAIAPAERDRSSNLYRTLEDQNLHLNIIDSFPFGQGFGIPIQYRIPLVDLSPIDPVIRYVPHDDVLWVWLRLGIVGFAAFWALIATVLVKSARALRFGDRKAALFAAFTTVAVIGYLIEGNYDYGFFWFRIAILMGLLMGSIEAVKLVRPATQDAPSVPTPAGTTPVDHQPSSLTVLGKCALDDSPMSGHHVGRST